MRVISQQRFGGPEVLEVVEAAVPDPLPTEIRVRVQAAGVNPVDWKTREGKGMAKALGKPPFSVGWDTAGVVDEVGPGVTRFTVGDRVMGVPWFPRQAAAYADYVVGPARQFVPVPDGVDIQTAAATPLAATTAWQILHDVAKIQSGQRVLVIAAGGGVGHIAVQLAKLAGTHVSGVDSADKLAWLGKHGLDEGHDFREGDFSSVFTEQDVVVDFIGGEQSLRALNCLRPGGIVVAVPSSVLGDGLEEAAAAERIRVGRIIIEPDRVALEDVAARLAADELTVQIGATFDLEDAADAHRAGESAKVTGKIVLTVD